MKMTIADEVSNLAIRLEHLELKSQADENTIGLLKQQNEMQAIELAKLRHDHDAERQALRHERDVATRKAKEVSGLIDTMGSLALAGMRKMRGDETPAVIPDKPMPAAKNLEPRHLQALDRAMPVIEDERIPRNGLSNRAVQTR